MLDFAEVHDWGRYGSDTEALPGSVDGHLPSPESPAQTAKIGCSFAIAGKLGKLLVVGEADIEARDQAGRTRRASLFQEKIAAAFADGASGYLVWQLNTRNTDGYALLPDKDDPLITVHKGKSDDFPS